MNLSIYLRYYSAACIYFSFRWGPFVHSLKIVQWDSTRRTLEGYPGRVLSKIHMVKWKTICLSKKKEGLGIQNLSTLNRALLGKWAWRFAFEENVSWRKFISLKYGTVASDWFTREPKGSYWVGLWKEIFKEVGLLKTVVLS